MADTKLTALSAVSVPDPLDLLYLVDVSDTTDSAAGSSRQVTAERTLGLNNGTFQARISGATGVVPVSVTNQTVISTLYLVPYGGNVITLYDGTRWISWKLSPIAIILTGLTSARPYDMWALINTATPSSTNTGTDIVTFAADPGWQTGAQIRVATSVGGLNAGTTYFYNRASSTTGSFHITIGSALIASSKVDLTANITQAVTGVSMEYLAWSSGTARATALTTQNGVYVKTGDATRRYIGTFYTSSTTTTEDTESQRFVWNYYNRVTHNLKKQELTDNWTYSSTTIRPMNNSTANRVEFVIGVAEDITEVDGLVSVLEQSAGGGGSIFTLGVDSTTVATFDLAGVTYWTPAGNVLHVMTTCIKSNFAAGYHYVQALEAVTVGTIVSTFYGDAGSANVAAGLSGVCRC